MYLSFHLFIYLLISFFIYLFYLFICLFIYLFIIFFFQLTIFTVCLILCNLIHIIAILSCDCNFADVIYYRGRAVTNVGKLVAQPHCIYVYGCNKICLN